MKYTLFIFAMLLNFQVSAQQKPKLELFTNAYVAKNMNDDVYLNAKKGVVYFYAIAFSFDQKGQIDTLYYSNKLSPIINRLLKINSLLKDIKTKSFKYTEYAG